AEVQRRLLIGTYVLSAGYYDSYFLKAQKVRRLIKNDFLEAFRTVDAILTPTAPTGAFSIQNPPTDPIVMYMNDVWTVPASLAGMPGVSIPAALTDNGLPLGLQVIAPEFEEGRLLNVASVLEEAANFDHKIKELRKVS